VTDSSKEVKVNFAFYWLTVDASGYYADTEAQCQVFHICSADGEGGLAKYSFLCPNGTVFNQEYFICDWWFNFDCAQAEALYSRNDEIRAEQESNVGNGGQNGNGFNGNGFNGENGNGLQQPIYVDDTAEDDFGAYDDGALAPPAPAADDQIPLDDYDLAPVEEEAVAPVGAYGAPLSEDARSARRFRQGRRLPARRGFRGQRRGRARRFRNGRRPFRG